MSGTGAPRADGRPAGPPPPETPDPRRSFDTQAERYAARRPTFPDALFDRLAAYAGLVVTSAFEDWPLPGRTFDAAVCATAWHWLDPAARLPKVVEALRPGGSVAIVRTHHVAGGTADVFARAQDCYRRWDPAAPVDFTLPAEGDLVPSTGELAVSPLVADVERHLYPVELTYAADDYLDLLRTYSPIIALTPPQREGVLRCLRRLVEEAGGQVTKRYAFELVLGRSAA